VTLAIILAGVSLLVSGATLLTVLALLGRKDFQYATCDDLQEVLDRLAVVGRGQAQIYRYVEAVDDHLGCNGHRVLCPPVPGPDPEA
jgi:hypothetical protein